ncbi:MBL fold metallo-hydrolase [Sphingobacterium alkalisoli]|uniref:MBL fold metallo-hydrolase n=1 Tax=Sphingobacterium alkalisoli TaxID=1874115 RepID=A0A4U0GXN4_9SPHI|nr:MBL fold metallo-hydrolase [Sphingobacterium alkalisoli]TJY63796.1 MBL fold metallo-hydrolase [Sphingobacterium alkalisoli]GGH24839.1 MBL fold metallo-hydrolase [Sphingobacterium alkalisoli]
MKLTIVGSGSKGNAYIVHNDKEALLIEAGVNFKAVKAALDFDIAKVSGCIVTHSHNDHAGYAKDVTMAGIDLYCLKATAEAKGLKGHRVHYLLESTTYHIGNFKVIAMPVRHDVPCVSFLIEHPETGRFCFVTDTIYCEYVFPGLNNIIVEANYGETIIDEKNDAKFLRDRILQSHMSIETCEQFLQANDLSSINNIVLIHLSDRNSHAVNFKNKVKSKTGASVHIADNGMEIDFGKTPF